MTEQRLIRTFTAQVPKLTKEGVKFDSLVLTSITDVVNVLHAWYKNDVRRKLGEERAKQEIRSIGEELDRQGGIRLMSAVAHATVAANRRIGSRLGSRLNFDWNGIGNWQA